MDLNKSISKLDNILSNYQTNDKYTTNNNTEYYSFYLPTDISEIEYDNIFHHLVFNCSDFMMNLNINAILANDIFEGLNDDPYSFLSLYQIYSSDDNADSNEFYKFSLYDVNGDYLFSYYSDKLSFFGRTTLFDAPELARHLRVIDDSLVLDASKVIDDYYSGTTIDFSKEQINLFDTYHSVEGNLSDLLPD